MGTNSYDFKTVLDIGKQASLEITEFLLSLPETVDVINVEDDSMYQGRDIDLIWLRYDGESLYGTEIEVKGDRYFRTGNFYLETVSNTSKNTPGCFMYTEAEEIFYYFVPERELFLIPTKKARAWFVENMDKFPEKKVFTPVRGQGYYTLGRIVPRHLIPGVQRLKIP